MASNVDNVVGAGHNIEVIVFILKAGVGGFVVAWKFFHIGFNETVIRLPQGWQATRRHR